MLDRSSFPLYDHFSGKCGYSCHLVLTILSNKVDQKPKIIQRAEKFMMIWSGYSLQASSAQLTYKMVSEVSK